MSTTDTGRLAEQAAAGYLEQLGFVITDRNWRTKWCEVDIVARRDGEIHLVEVKYRQHQSFGGGFGAINADKIRRLQRAALAFSRANDPVVVDVISVTGRPGRWQIELLENAIGAG